MHRRKLLQLSSLIAAGSLLPVPTISATPLVGSKTNGYDRTRLNANENPYGPSPEVARAIQRAIESSNRYPIAGALPSLKTAIAQYHNISEDQILINAGSYQALRIIGSRFGVAGGNHIAPDLSFTALMRQAEQSGCQWIKVPVKSDKSIDLDQMLKRINDQTRFIYVTNPNNPTGHYYDKNTILDFCRNVPSTIPIIMDEAYIEFVDSGESHSMTSHLMQFPNMIITRTFSKIYGLAGLRVGYILAKPSWISEWDQWDQNGGLGVSGIGATAAETALNDQEFRSLSKIKIDKTRKNLEYELSNLGLKVFPSVTNFILINSAPIEKKLVPLLEKEKIDIGIGRSGAMQNLCRISIGTDHQVDQLLTLIKSVI